MSSWKDYFTDFGGYYWYEDKNVVKLPDNLPMPPTTNMCNLFHSCEKLQDISALANWDVSKVNDMCGMFRHCKELQDISALANWDTSKVTCMGCMFRECQQLQDISALSEWNTNKVTDMDFMFYGCVKLKDFSALANWNISKVTDINSFSDSMLIAISSMQSYKQKTSSTTDKARIKELESRLSALEEKFQTFMKIFQELGKLCTIASQENEQE